jgi:membrane-associated phospholipid phosphatase
MNLRNYLLISTILFFPRIIYSQQVNADTLNLKSIQITGILNQVIQPQWVKATIVPTALFVVGGITLLADSKTLLSRYTIHNKIINQFSGTHSFIDNYLQYTPLVAALGLNMAGIRGRSDFANLMVITAKAELLMTFVVQGMKSITNVARPSGEPKSMPSGHTAKAFVSATILDMEYRNTSPWISVAGYAVAMTTGMYRMINNEHWISDVFIGAGVGILSTKIVYFTHRYAWGKKRNMVIIPTILKNGGGISFGMVI